LPDGEQPEQLSEAEAAELEELEARYGRRTLGTNADRYEEPEPEIGADGMNNIECKQMRCNLINRTTNRRTGGRFESVPRAATHGGPAWIAPRPSHCG